ncbi:MAG: flagellar biosynthetic protein FliQ, partial [Gemmataceae bacterium]|nr:flagellar biosynthetic protein FliQ [Gemmataceae bacterium]
MSMEWVNELGRDLFTTALMIALPALLVSFVVGLVVSILQTVTSIQDQTLSFVPR